MHQNSMLWGIEPEWLVRVGKRTTETEKSRPGPKEPKFRGSNNSLGKCTG